MTVELKDTFFTQYGQHFSQSDVKRGVTLPFKEHPQFPVLIDILSRKNHHHVLLSADFSFDMHATFLEALLQHLNHEHIPHHLQGAELIYLNLENALFSDIKQIAIEKDFDQLRDNLNHSDKYFLIALTRSDLFSKEAKKSDERFLRRQMEMLLTHPRCRILLMTHSRDFAQHNHLDDVFTTLTISGPTDSDTMTALRQQRLELELFHHVIIPEELLTQALLLTERYLSASNPLEKTLLLLDSSAARAGAAEPVDHTSQIKPVLTTATLLNVLSDWTKIPSSHLQINQFKHSEFTHGLHQRVFGQDTAVTILGHELLQAQAHLQQKNGPFSSFLFAGPAHSGKKTTAIALVEQLFKQLNVLHFAQPAFSHQLLTDIKLQRCLDKQFQTITDVIRETPYAVIMFENIEKLPATILDGLQEILSTGYLHDSHGNQYNFRQSIIILSTTIGANSLAEFAETHIPEDDIYTMDLMQLVMSDQKPETHHQIHQFTAQEIIEKMMPDITDAFTLSFCQHLHLVPFLPLNKAAIEKIMRLKLKILGKQLETRYQIELGYAPEVIRFLTHDVLMRREKNNQIVNPNKALKQLYFCVEQTILNQAEHNNRSNQLFLQLNETGHLLRCDWLAAATTRQHAN